MNTAYIEGYVSTKYTKTRETASGKRMTTFQLSSKTGRKRDDGKAEYQYFHMECWHDDFGTQDGIVDGAYAHIECVPRAWKTDKGSGVSFTVRRIWVAPPKGQGASAPQDGSTVMNAVAAASQDSGAYVEDYQQTAMYADDIPF